MKPVRLAAIMLVKDERDVIGHTIYHLLMEGCERVIVKDNLSTDGTRSILEGLQEATAGQVLVLSDDQLAYYQSEKTTGLLQFAQRLGYTWVIPCDADEIWHSHYGTLAEVIAAHDRDFDVIPAELYDHISTSSDPADADPFRRLGYHFREPGALPKVAVRTRLDMVIEQGNHGARHVARPGYSQGPLRWREGPGLTIRHFSWRSPEQYLRKITNGARAYAATKLPDDVGAHWRMFGSPDDEGFAERVTEHFYEWFYVEDPEGDERLIFDPAPVADKRPPAEVA